MNFKFLSVGFILVFKLNAQDTLTVQQAVEIGLKNNYTITIARHEANIGEISNPGFNGLLPAVSATASQNNNINDTRQQFFSGEIRDKSGAKASNLNAGVQLNWTVFDGFNMFATLQQFDEFEKLGALNARITIENTVSDIITTYYSIAQQQKKIEVMRNAIEISLERRKIADERLRLGAGSGLDVLQANVDMNTDSSTLLREEYLLINNKIMLNQLLGRQPETQFTVNNVIPVDVTLQFDALSKKLSEQNPELEAARKNNYISVLALRQARSNYYPEISVNTGYTFAESQSEVGLLQSSRNQGLNYGLTASWNLFTGFNNKRLVERAKVEQLISQQQLSQAELNIKSSLYGAFSNYRMTITRIDLERRSMQVARQNLDIASEKMRLGTINTLELREAQRNLIDAEFRLIVAQYEAKAAETDLRRLSGGLINP